MKQETLKRQTMTCHSLMSPYDLEAFGRICTPRPLEVKTKSKTAERTVALQRVYCRCFCDELPPCPGCQTSTTLSAGSRRYWKFMFFFFPTMACLDGYLFVRSVTWWKCDMSFHEAVTQPSGDTCEEDRRCQLKHFNKCLLAFIKMWLWKVSRSAEDLHTAVS